MLRARRRSLRIRRFLIDLAGFVALMGMLYLAWLFAIAMRGPGV